ncbi:MAG TPA: YciI family protein [Solirubrobacteraceae bacterium]|nr:YciI family protein [Solirubrobacteraceae bacterium]
MSIGAAPVRLSSDHPGQEDAKMKYAMLIHQGDAPTPNDPEAWGRLSEEEQKQVYADYMAINQNPAVTPGLQMQPPETATTVRVQDGRTLTTDGPFVAVKEALGGWFVLEADDLDAAIAIAASVPAARLGGGVEVRPLVER